MTSYIEPHHRIFAARVSREQKEHDWLELVAMYVAANGSSSLLSRFPHYASVFEFPILGMPWLAPDFVPTKPVGSVTFGATSQLAPPSATPAGRSRDVVEREQAMHEEGQRAIAAAVGGCTADEPPTRRNNVVLSG